MSDDYLQIQVAGTTISMKESEAALVIYAASRHEGKQVSMHLQNGNYFTDGRFIERAVGTTSICAVIFPRIPMKDRQEDTCWYTIPYWRDSDFISYGVNEGRAIHGNVVIYAGNVAEVDIRRYK